MKILLVKLSSLGDVVHALPVVQDILAAVPNAKIDWVVEKSFAPVLVLRFEGHTQAALERIEADMLALLRSVKPDAKIAAAAH